MKEKTSGKRKTKDEKESEKSSSRSITAKIVKVSIIVMIIISIVVGIPWAFEYYGCPYHTSYTRPGVRNNIEKYSSTATQEFGEVYSPSISLSNDCIWISKFESIPGPTSTQYGIWCHDTLRGAGSKLVGLVQLPPTMKSLTKQQVIDLVDQGQLLCGGIVHETLYHNYSWNDLPRKMQEKLLEVSSGENFGDIVNSKYAWGKLSITKIRDIPNDVNEQTLIAYLEETPYGYKKKEILVHSWY